MHTHICTYTHAHMHVYIFPCSLSLFIAVMSIDEGQECIENYKSHFSREPANTCRRDFLSFPNTVYIHGNPTLSLPPPARVLTVCVLVWMVLFYDH